MKNTSCLALILLYHWVLIAQSHDSIIVSNAVLHYWIQGKGQPVLLLSGGPGIASAQLSGLSESLSKNYKCVLFDQRGTGNSHTSPMDSSTINLNQALEDINLLLERINIKKVSIIGHSWGAMLAMSYAAKYPDRITKLVLIGPGPLEWAGYELLQDNIMSRASKAEKMVMSQIQDSIANRSASRESMRTLNRTFLRLLFFDALKVDSLGPLINAGSNNAMQQLMLRDLNRINYNLKPHISKMQIPILVVCGRQDPVGLFSTFTIKDLNKTAKIVWVEKSGHFPWVERPESFYSDLLAFLQ
jgi:proline-specific peptidase